MIRLLGAITGSALALAALLVLVGVPQFKAEPNDIERTVVTLPLRTVPVKEVTEPEAIVESPPKDEIPDSIEEVVAVPETVVEVLLPDSQQWFAFWSPFRSEIAASGFVTQLQRVTGLDYRIVKIEPGVYEVAFAYAADEDISMNLSQISAATGLDLPEN